MAKRKIDQVHKPKPAMQKGDVALLQVFITGSRVEVIAGEMYFGAQEAYVRPDTAELMRLLRTLDQKGEGSDHHGSWRKQVADFEAHCKKHESDGLFYDVMESFGVANPFVFRGEENAVGVRIEANPVPMIITAIEGSSPESESVATAVPAVI